MLRGRFGRHKPQAYKVAWNAGGGRADDVLTYDSLSVSDHSLERLGELRAAFGASEELVNLTDSQMREMLVDRYAR